MQFAGPPFTVRGNVKDQVPLCLAYQPALRWRDNTIFGMDEDGVQAQATTAGEPFRTGRVLGERVQLFPGFASIVADEKACFFGAGVQRIRL
jgi:hypothetical protein